MAFDEKTVKIDPVSFSHARPFYADIHGVSLERLDELSLEGQLKNFGLFEAGKQIGAISISVEYSGEEKWLIVNAYSARAGRDMTRFMEEHGVALAIGTSCAGIRLWTARAGLQRKLEAKGWTTSAVMELRTDGR